ncbi:hypothetical protein DBIPINDM_004531 [Mesorhizobium sp. AR02]|uniref:hypothetical protein n=1 Tax=Mesorhizobium sp. AR02 TaxID=2865837 RepID=UPI00215FD0E7|nr:hypothetical protein [Mesorhizobium sp. AR02]UVK51288.1 hypothetical protein DBIPINDM_004531 [Mesorhizobium sp. AR02]
MNRALVSTLSAINAILAVAIILIFGILGNAFLGQGGGVELGLIIGFVVAAILCGGLAALCLIEKHLRVLADDLRQQRKKITSPVRTEPSIR